MDLKPRLAQLLMAKSYITGDFVMTSGLRSTYYFDCKQTALDAEGAFCIGSLFCDMLTGSPARAVAGMTLGADPLVAAVAVVSFQRQRPLSAIIVRKEPKGHGTGAYLEGVRHLPVGTPVAMLEDVVTTAGTLIRAIDRVRDAGYEVTDVLTILDREEGGRENLAAKGYDLRAIFTKRELFGLAGVTP